MNDCLRLAAARKATAERLLDELKLVERWGVFGRPVIVGALAYDLMYARDIDMEIYCPKLRIEDGFEVLRACALHPLVTQTMFVNALATPDKALYWQLLCRDEEGGEWKVDMWSAPEDYPLPRAEYLVEPIRRALNPELRQAIIHLKGKMAEDKSLSCISIHLYRAVISGGVRTVDQWREWLSANDTSGLTAWRP